ncbi:hypothetical protein MMC07_005099 [Pseudocyphellaria aurata]|nr:hypothetical protein [Pseudocyphellaria aurata]
MRYARNPTFLPLGASLIYATHRSKPLLLNDSSSDTPWPKARAISTDKKRSDKESKDDRFAKPGPDIATVSDAAVGNAGNKDLVTSAEDDDESAAWVSFSSTLASASSAINAIPWSILGDKITDYIIPAWARVLPGQIAKLQQELNMSAGSLADEIWQEAHDLDINPEIAISARVRIGKELCREEKEFQQRRKKHTTHALAKYLDISESEINPEDVPTIAMCGSGGGLRAMVAGCGSYLGAQEAGLFDCVTYTAGVSGSCWLQILYYSTIGEQNHQKIVDHLKYRIGTHIAFPPDALQLLTTAPTNKFLLSGFVEKLKGHPNADLGLVDIYGLLLAARLLVPRGELGVNAHNLKISNQRAYLTDGKHPLPIYTAVRHEIPIEEKTSDEERVRGTVSDAAKEKAKQEAWFQWFEFTPYELFCEELDAGIPSWGVGRRYQSGRSIPDETGLHLPEYRIPIMMGIWGSAFCATLAHYYKEIRPILKGITGFGGVDDIMEERNDDLTKIHPIEPASLPNYVLGLRERLPRTCPEGIFKSEHLQLADAGMSNNLPLYPLLRDERGVDILIAFDSSADIKTENWLSVADGYAKQRGIKGWPIGAGWPKEGVSKDNLAKELDIANAKTPQEAAGKIADARETQRTAANATQETLGEIEHEEGHDVDLGYCNVWVGTTLERTSESEPPPSKRVNPDVNWELLSPDAGLTVVYFPLLPNANVEGIDPNTTDFLSTWNFIYSGEEIDKVISLARSNFEEGKDQTRRTVRAVYERKRAKRLQQEERDRIQRWKRHLRDHGDHFQ